ncbi:MAG: HipA domain-containing protein [Propionibacteriaceae bacterium]|nr:HipA domain-containing protein [Propionibacteriaceae bacterium]
MRQLDAWLEGTFVGRFTQPDSGTVHFEYASDAGTPISLSMPRGEAWKPNAPFTFLENLLPDRRETRKRMAEVLCATSPSTFDLLEVVGTDIAGGLVLVPAGVNPFAFEHPYREASFDDIAYRMRALRDDPDTWIDTAVQERFSLAGSQAKFALSRSHGVWYWSSPSLPSTHILKPGKLSIDHVQEIEVWTMRLSQVVGIDTPFAGILKVFDQSSYIVERFDRDRSNGTVSRIHVEDFAQATGMRSGDKYKLTAPSAITMLRSVDPSDTLGYEFIERLAFNVSVANVDAHAKNYSVFIRPDGVTLAPMYDAICVAYWPRFRSNLGMHIGKAYRYSQVTPTEWASLARESGLDTDRVLQIAIQVASRVTEVVQEGFGSAEVGLELVPPDTMHRLVEVINEANKSMPTNEPNWSGQSFHQEFDLGDDDPTFIHPFDPYDLLAS